MTGPGRAPPSEETVPEADETWADPLDSASPRSPLPHTTPPRPGSGVPPQPAGSFADRYDIIDALGRGGVGQVFRARDRLTGELVAVKQVSAFSPADLRSVRQEVTALRWLRLPGVVHLRDDGMHGGSYFVVMDLIQGRPFPGAAVPLPWPTLAPRIQRLLESLGRIHRAGVIHRDLKPANILVDADGVPHILDFGLALGGALAPGAARRAGTPAYAAPEQIQGDPCTPRTDLYAVGILLYEGLTGHNPHAASSSSDILRRRLETPPPRLPDTFPPVLVETVAALLRRDPAARPESAEAVLAALGLARPAPPLPLPAGRPATPDELRALFAGPDLFLHLSEDAGAALWARTGGEPGRVSAELDAWLQAGLIYRTEPDGLFVITRPTLARIQAGLRLRPPTPPPEGLSEEARRLLYHLQAAFPDTSPALVRATCGLDAAAWARARAALATAGLTWPLPDGRIGCEGGLASPDAAVHVRLADAAPQGSATRLRHRLAARAPTAAILADARAVLQDLLAEGEYTRILGVLELALSLARQEQDAAAERALLEQWCAVALAQEATPPLDRALYELGRAQVPALHLEPLQGLLQAARAQQAGEGRRALALVDALAPFADEALDVWRQSVRIEAAASQGSAAQEALLHALVPWATTPLRQAKLAGWWGNLRYQQGHYLEAAHLHQQAAAGKTSRDARLSSMLNAADALLEALHLDEAAALVEEVQAQAAQTRHALYALSACCTARILAYRRDTAGPPQPALVEAAAHLGGWLEGLLAMTEAAIAWRRQEVPLAATLAGRAAQVFGRHGLHDHQRFVRALLAAIQCALPEDASALQQQLLDNPVADLALQGIGLLALAGLPSDDRVRQRAAVLASSRPPTAWPVRLDVLSLQEALDALGA